MRRTGCATAIASHRPDVLLTECEMPVLNGLEVAGCVRRDFPMTKLVIVSVNPADQADLSEVVQAGASGYLPKESGAAELRLAIATVARGGSFLGPAIANGFGGNGSPPDAGKTEVSRILTRRQREILRKIALARPRSRSPGISASARRRRRRRRALMERLDIYHVAGLVRYAIRERAYDAEE